MKGLTERRVLYGHVFRNAMLIVIAGFPGAFVARLLHGLAADRAGVLARRARLSLLQFADPARLSGRARQPLHLRAARPRGEPDLRPHLHLDRSAHRFRNARGMRVNPREGSSSSPDSSRKAVVARRLGQGEGQSLLPFTEEGGRSAGPLQRDERDERRRRRRSPPMDHSLADEPATA